MIKKIFQKIKQNHFLAMVLCCTIPLVGILVLSSMGKLGSWGYYALLLICPLGHLLMMRGMHSASHDNKTHESIKEIEYTKSKDLMNQ